VLGGKGALCSELRSTHITCALSHTHALSLTCRYARWKRLILVVVATRRRHLGERLEVERFADGRVEIEVRQCSIPGSVREHV
jgi:hypothetical protein